MSQIKKISCENIKEVSKRLYEVASAIENGVPMSRACFDNGIDYSYFRRFSSFQMVSDCQNPNSKPIFLDYTSWEEDLLTAITGCSDFVAVKNFDKALEKAMETLTDREKEVILMRYIDGRTREDIGKEIGITRERIRQIEAKALRKLRHPTRFKYLAYGPDTDFVTEEEKIKEQKERIAEKKKQLDDVKAQLNKVELELDEEIMLTKYKLMKAAEKDLLEDMDLSVRSYNCLRRAGITTVKQLASFKFVDFMNIRNMGRKSVEEVIRVLKDKYDITLG